MDCVNTVLEEIYKERSNKILVPFFLCLQIWYDNKELFPMKLIDMQVIGAMRPPDGSSNTLSGRFIRHFNTLNIDLFTDTTIASIFSRIVLWHLDTKGFSKEFDPCIDQIVHATLNVHKFVVANLLPTPDHSHYLFSLKEFSRFGFKVERAHTHYGS